MQDLVSSLAAVLLAGTFAWAAIAKALRFSRWRDALRGYDLSPRWIEPVARFATPVAEAAIAAALAAGAVKPGAAGALALLAAFSSVLFSARRAHGVRLPCGCFGGATVRDYRIMLLRNSVLALCAAAVLVRPEAVALGRTPGAPGAADVVPAALVGLGIVAAFVVLWQVDAAARRARRR